jgi:nucleotide-binding universal stress UspA family protein
MRGWAHGPIVVGVDDDDRAAVALSWAAHEAVVSDRSLRLVHAHPLPTSLMLVGGFVDGWDEIEPAWQSTRLLDGAADLIGELAPGVPVSTCASPGGPVPLLLAEADRAGMVVLGSHGAGVVSDVMIGTVCGAVASRASCPVVAITGRPAWPDALIVVGVDDAATAAPALAFAFALAQRRGAPLRLHHVRRPRDGAGHPSRAAHYQLDRHQARYPGVAVGLTETCGDPVGELTNAVADAQLLVLGTARHCGFSGLFRRSVGHALLRRPPCSLAIVPTVG